MCYALVTPRGPSVSSYISGGNGNRTQTPLAALTRPELIACRLSQGSDPLDRAPPLHISPHTAPGGINSTSKPYPTIAHEHGKRFVSKGPQAHGCRQHRYSSMPTATCFDDRCRELCRMDRCLAKRTRCGCAVRRKESMRCSPTVYIVAGRHSHDLFASGTVRQDTTACL